MVGLEAVVLQRGYTILGTLDERQGATSSPDA